MDWASKCNQRHAPLAGGNSAQPGPQLGGFPLALADASAHMGTAAALWRVVARVGEFPLTTQENEPDFLAHQVLSQGDDIG